MHILFYLPVVTPWWFDSIVAPMIRAAARGAEVSVLVPPMWRNTGIGPEQLQACSDVEGINWFILDGEDHPRLRTSGLGEQDLIDFVRELNPDLTLCRSADIETPKLFPGIVRYIMEAAAPPFVSDPTMVWLSETLCDHGLVPEIDPRQRAWLNRAIEPLWAERVAVFQQIDRQAFRDSAGFAPDKKIIAMPLEYEHPEIFFNQHNLFENNIALIDSIAGELDDDHQLAVTNHPLNELHCDTRPLEAAIARHAGKVRLIRKIGVDGLATALLAAHCDAMIVGNSKSFALCGFFGTPMLRLSRFRTGAWMCAYDAVDRLLPDLRAGRAAAATQDDARLWFAFHLFNNSFDPSDRRLDAAALGAIASRTVNEARWAERARDFLPPARIAA